MYVCYLALFLLQSIFRTNSFQFGHFLHMFFGETGRVYGSTRKIPSERVCSHSYWIWMWLPIHSTTFRLFFPFYLLAMRLNATLFSAPDKVNSFTIKLAVWCINFECTHIKHTALNCSLFDRSKLELQTKRVRNNAP